MNPNTASTNQLQDQNTEKAVLGACLKKPEGILEIETILTPEDFSSPRHQRIYKALLSLKESKKHIDLLSVVQQLREMGEFLLAGGEDYLKELFQNPCEPHVLAQHAKTIQNFSARKQALKATHSLVAKAKDSSCPLPQALSTAQTTFRALQSASSSADFKFYEALLYQLVENLRIHPSPPCTGYPLLTEYLSGYSKGALIVVGGRTSMGKTTFMINLAYNLIKETTEKALFITLEMEEDSITQDLTTIHLNWKKCIFEMENFFPDYEEKLKIETFELRQKENFCCIQPHSRSIETIKNICRSAVRKHQVRVIFIDYLQLITEDKPVPTKLRHQLITEISGTLKSLAQELEITIVTGAQLNRVNESATSKRPTLASLRESGSIEQDADVVLLLYRPEQYGIDEYGENEEAEPSKNKADVIIAKNRRGRTATLRFGCDLSRGKFTEDREVKITTQSNKKTTHQPYKTDYAAPYKPVDMTTPDPSDPFPPIPSAE